MPPWAQFAAKAFGIPLRKYSADSTFLFHYHPVVTIELMRELLIFLVDFLLLCKGIHLVHDRKPNEACKVYTWCLIRNRMGTFFLVHGFLAHIWVIDSTLFLFEYPFAKIHVI